MPACVPASGALGMMLTAPTAEASGAATTSTGEPVQLYTTPVGSAPTIPPTPARRADGGGTDARNVTAGGTSTGSATAGTTTAPQVDPPRTPAEPSAAELAARLPTLLREAQGGNYQYRY